MKKILIAVLAVALLFTFSACDDGQSAPAEFKVDDSIAKVAGVEVTLGNMTKKVFSAENGDSESRVEKFGEYGELDCVNITVSGTVSKADCVANAIPMNQYGEETTADKADINYYTDFFALSMLVPENATRCSVNDGLPDGEIENFAKDSTGYYTEKVQWLLADASKTNWTGCGTAETDDGYFYYAFYTADDEEPIKEFFVRVDYSDLEFVD